MLEGDRNSLSKIMHAHFRPLYQYGTRFSIDGELIKDSIQELFINIWERRAQLSSSVHVKSYLFASLRRLILKKLKNLSKTSTISLEEYKGESFLFTLSVDQKMIVEEDAQRLSRHFSAIIHELPHRQREVIYLRFFHSMSRDEIAVVMEIAPQTVSNILQIALGKLREKSIPFFKNLEKGN
jgi:RNA polymerase sigma factor (sigma-70 family)